MSSFFKVGDTDKHGRKFVAVDANTGNFVAKCEDEHFLVCDPACRYWFDNSDNKWLKDDSPKSGWIGSKAGAMRVLAQSLPIPVPGSRIKPVEIKSETPRQPTEMEDALRNCISIIEQLIPEPSARGVANAVLFQARHALKA